MLPFDAKLPIGKLQRVFNTVTTSYKYFWFWSIVRMVVRNKATQSKEYSLAAETEPLYGNNSDSKPGVHMDIRDIFKEMLLLAWSPSIRYRLNLVPDRTADKIRETLLTILPDEDQKMEKAFFISQQEIIRKIDSWTQSNGFGLLDVFQKYVPYRFLCEFLVPLVNRDDHSTITQWSLENPVIYQIIKQGPIIREIIVSPELEEYILSHPQIIESWIKFKLLEYLQKNNPNVPALVNKLE